MAQGIHTEASFEALVEAHLVNHGGYDAVSPTGYDRELALMPDLLAGFIQTI